MFYLRKQVFQKTKFVIPHFLLESYRDDEYLQIS